MRVLPDPVRRPLADAAAGRRHLFVRDLVLPARIGVYDHERDGAQRVRINLDLAVEEPPSPEDRLENVVCYDELVAGVRRLLVDGHVNLIETLAERIAGLCLEDARVRTARVRVEKLDAIPDAAAVGVEIERANPRPQ